VLAAIVASVVGAVWATYDIGYKAGANAVTAAYAESMAVAAEKQKDSVKEVIKWRTKREVVYRDRIEEISTAEDKARCLDIRLDDAGLGGMLRAGDADRPGITATDSTP